MNERCAFSQRLGFVRLLEGGGRGRSENEKRQSIELDLNFRSKKERRSNVEMARSGVLWRGYAHQVYPQFEIEGDTNSRRGHE